MRRVWIGLLVFVASLGAHAQTTFNCSSFTTTNTSCGVGGLISGSGSAFKVIGSQNGATPAVSGGNVIIANSGITHFALTLMNQTPQTVSAFATTFTFIPNGQNIALMFNNCANNGATGVGTCDGFNLANFSSGASCEGDFYQEYSPNAFPYNVFALMFDSYAPLSGSSFTYSSAQIYQQNQSPCVPSPGGPIVQPYWQTTKFSTSPVPLNSPATSQGTTTGHTYSATVTYDGSTVTLNLFDVTGGGSCPGASCYTQTWSNVSIPSQVDGTTAYVGIGGSTGAAATGNLVVTGWSWTANTPTASPGSTVTAAGSPTAANPTFSPAPGTYAGTQTVTMTCPTGGSNKVYTLGSPGLTLTPLANQLGGAAVGTPYSGPITVSSTSTLYGVCGLNGTGTSSGVVQGAYTIGGGSGNNWPIAAGASLATMQSTINSAAASTTGPNTVSFAAGPYSFPSHLTVPCPVRPLTIQGPAATYVPPSSLLPSTYAYSTPYTANLTGSVTNGSGWIVSSNGCTQPITIQYFNWNGGQPSGGGGGWIQVAAGASNVTIQNFYAHGVWASTTTAHNYDDLIDIEGVGPSQFPIDSNIKILWGVAGDGVSDCNPIMNLTTYQGGAYSSSGGYCGAVGVHVSTTNLVIQNNDFEHLEQPVKMFEGTQTSGDITHTYMLNNALVDSNDFGQYHRIGLEAQQSVNQNNSTGSVFNGNNNSFHDPITPNFGQFAFSLPMCCTGFYGYTSSDNQVNCNNNVQIANVQPSSSGFLGYANEWWSTGSCSNNLMQGWWSLFGNGNAHNGAGDVGYGFTNTAVRTWTASHNICQFATANGVCISNEEGSGPPPTQTGNTSATGSTARASVAPTISPSPGAYSSPLSVTLTDPGDTSGTGPQGHTSIWYTTDGSTPVPGGASSQLYTLPITVSLPATVKAVGMWGALNQPKSYPSGYGFAPSSVTTASYAASGGVTLSSVSIASTGGVSTLSIGATVQMIVTCHYSDGSTSGCNTTDSHGNAVTGWASSTGNVTVSSTGLATGAGVGTSVITATVTGGFTTSPGVTLTITGTALTLSSVSLATAGGVSSMNAGTTNQLLDTCHYSDGSATSCNTTDSHGNAVSTYNSSAPAIATVTSSGVVTGVAGGSTNLTGTVNPAPSILGTSLQNVTGFTNNGFINEIYGVTGTSPGSYAPGNCHIIIPATTNWVAGKLWTCLLVLGTPTTQSAAALCSNTYTMTGTSWPGGDIIISMASCPALPPDQGYWVGSTTNQTAASPVQGFSNCNSSCSGGAPVFGSGSYSYRYVANTFGSYTSLPTTLTASNSPGQQVSQYVELTTTPVTSGNLPLSVTTPPPSLVSAYLTASSGSMIVGSTMQMAAKCHYTSGPDQDCTVADIYGDAVSAWLSSDPSKATVNDAGASNPGLVTAVSPGTPSITATIGTGTTSSPYPITVSSPAVTLTGVSLSLTGGVTGLFVGATNQLKATCAYSDGSSDDCTTTDAHGNLAHSYVSTAPAHATVNAASGLVTGVAPGATTFTAVAGSLTSNPLPLAVFPVLSGIYAITVSGPVKFSGTVRF